MRSTIVGMTSLTEQLPYVYAFPDALGTGLLVHTESVLDDEIRDRIGSFIHEYEVVLSRFRDDSIVGRMRTAAHGGTFDFPDWASGLFGLYDRLFAATDGATDPCVGEDLIRLGYDESYSFTPAPDAAEHAGAIHGRAIWSADVERHGTTLVTRGPVALDFGACGKGYLVDLLAGMLGDGAGRPQPIQYVIDAGGDLLVHTDEPITIALEDPADPANAVGTVEISHGAFCASSPSRRHWSDAAGHQLHHLLNAIDGLPVDDVAATWVAVTPPSSAITTKTSTHAAMPRQRQTAIPTIRRTPLQHTSLSHWPTASPPPCSPPRPPSCALTSPSNAPFSTPTAPPPNPPIFPAAFSHTNVRNHQYHIPRVDRWVAPLSQLR